MYLQIPFPVGHVVSGTIPGDAKFEMFASMASISKNPLVRFYPQGQYVAERSIVFWADIVL